MALAAVGDPVVRLSPAVAVASALARSGRAEAALDVIRTLPDRDRAEALLPLTSRLEGEAVAPALALAGELQDPVQRARVMARLTAPLVGADAAGVDSHVRQVLHLLAGWGTRRELAQAIPDLIPGLLALGGTQALVDLVAAVTAAQRWWP